MEVTLTPEQQQHGISRESSSLFLGHEQSGAIFREEFLRTIFGRGVTCSVSTAELRDGLTMPPTGQFSDDRKRVEELAAGDGKLKVFTNTI